MSYRTVIEKYRIALGFLGSVRALYPAHSPILAAAVKRVHDLEDVLKRLKEERLATV